MALSEEVALSIEVTFVSQHRDPQVGVAKHSEVYDASPSCLVRDLLAAWRHDKGAALNVDVEFALWQEGPMPRLALLQPDMGNTLADIVMQRSIGNKLQIVVIIYNFITNNW